MAFDLGCDYDNLEGSKKATKARALVMWFQQRGRLADLLEYAERERPHVQWPDVGQQHANSD